MDPTPVARRWQGSQGAGRVVSRLLRQRTQMTPILTLSVVVNFNENEPTTRSCQGTSRQWEGYRGQAEGGGCLASGCLRSRWLSWIHHSRCRLTHMVIFCDESPVRPPLVMICAPTSSGSCACKPLALSAVSHPCLPWRRWCSYLAMNQKDRRVCPSPSV